MLVSLPLCVHYLSFVAAIHMLGILFVLAIPNPSPPVNKHNTAQQSQQQYSQSEKRVLLVKPQALYKATVLPLLPTTSSAEVRRRGHPRQIRLKKGLKLAIQLVCQRLINNDCEAIGARIFPARASCINRVDHNKKLFAFSPRVAHTMASSRRRGGLKALVLGLTNQLVAFNW